MSLTVQVSNNEVTVSQNAASSVEIAQPSTPTVNIVAAGIVGPTGATGAQGAAGVTGSQGAQGAAGTNGAQGAQGAASNVAGSQGAQGSAGNNGAQGSPGTNGAQGAQGSAGNNGTNGAQGAQGAPGTSGTSTFPYSGIAQITGSLEILNTGSNAITTTSDGGIKVVRHSSAFGFPNTAWGGYLYPLSPTAIYSQAGVQLGTTKNPLALQPLSTAQDIALTTVNHGANVFVSASNEIYLGFGSSSPAKNYVRDLLVMSGSLQGSVRPLTITSSTASLNMSASNFFTLQLAAGSNTHVNVSGQQPGQTVNLRINTGGSGTVTFNSAVKQASGSSYTPTAGTGVDIVSLITFDSTDVYLANVKNLI
jgi:hypothetical protein